MRLEEKWHSWTLTVHKAWRQMIPAKNYTPETKYNLKWRHLPTTYETGHTTLQLSYECFSGPNLCTPCFACVLIDKYWGLFTSQSIFLKAKDCETMAGTFPRHLAGIPRAYWYEGYSYHFGYFYSLHLAFPEKELLLATGRHNIYSLWIELDWLYCWYFILVWSWASLWLSV